MMERNEPLIDREMNYFNHYTSSPSISINQQAVPNNQQIIPNTYSKSFPSCPNKTGPGLWFMLTIMALHANTSEDEEYFIRNLRLLSNLHPCGECREHMKKYISINPPENFIEFENGLFDYMITFHNTVNKRLGKPIMQYEDALYMYTEGLTDTVCTANCSSTQSDNDQSIDFQEFTPAIQFSDQNESNSSSLYDNITPVTIPQFSNSSLTQSLNTSSNRPLNTSSNRSFNTSSNRPINRPVTLSNRSINRPITSSNRPITSSNRSINRPITSSNRPVTSSNRPITSSNRPVTSSNRPITSSNGPITSSNGPITSSNRQITLSNGPITSSNRPINRPITSSNGPITSSNGPITSSNGQVNRVMITPPVMTRVASGLP